MVAISALRATGLPDLKNLIAEKLAKATVPA